jgi:hypothetical protein
MNALNRQGGFFGFKRTPPKAPVAKLDMSKFINRVTVEEMADIETTKARIVSVLEDLKSLEVEVFAKQKEVTHRLYDLFSKYNGPHKVEWLRYGWFNLTALEPVYHFHNDQERDEYEKTEARAPPEWATKMVHKGTNAAEIKKWNDYVDAQWDSAYENAFAVTPFRQFITTDIHAFLNVNLKTSKAADVERKWADLRDRTLYFHKKTTYRDHIGDTASWHFIDSPFDEQNIAHMWRIPTTYTESKTKYYGLADQHAIDIIEAFHKKTEELLALVTDLTWLSTPRWKQHWNRKDQDYWSNDQGKYPKRFTQPNYVVPRPVVKGIND